jgi:hypothetical protein
MFLNTGGFTGDNRSDAQKLVELKARFASMEKEGFLDATTIATAVAKIDELLANHEAAARQRDAAEASLLETKNSAAAAVATAEAVHSDTLKAFGESQAKINAYFAKFAGTIKV